MVEILKTRKTNCNSSKQYIACLGGNIDINSCDFSKNLRVC